MKIRWEKENKNIFPYALRVGFLPANQIILINWGGEGNGIFRIYTKVLKLMFAFFSSYLVYIS